MTDPPPGPLRGAPPGPPDAGSAWEPLAAGALAERAREAIAAVAAATRVGPGPVAQPDPGLAGGDAGLALFFHGLHAAWGAEEHAEAARALLLRSAAVIRGGAGPPIWLYRGVAGIAWAVAHLRARRLIAWGEEELRVVDGVVLRAVPAAPRSAYDLVRGIVGLGVYALERLPEPAAAEALERIVLRLDETAERTAEGAAWFIPPAALLPWQRERFPRGVHDLGVAHGAAGVVGLLARTVRAGVAAGRARPLLEDTVRWLRGRELPAASASRYPARILPGQPPEAARLAWCYGDPGVGVALLAAARTLRDAGLDAHAREVLRAATRRTEEDSGVVDTPLCHGAAGVAHLFHRAWRSTGDPALREAALRWLEATLRMRVPDQGAAGFAYRGMHDGRPSWSPRTGFLEGAAGVGLALLAAVSPVPPPAWDRILLADVGPAPALA